VGHFRLASIGKLLVGMASSSVVQLPTFASIATTRRTGLDWTDTYDMPSCCYTLDAPITKVAHMDGSNDSMNRVFDLVLHAV
jgi:hypothetical protein